MTQSNSPILPKETSSPQEIPSPKEKKLLDQYRDVINLKHYSSRTGDTYIPWAKEYILFHNKRHPKEMGAPEINQFLTYLASDKKNIRLHTESSSQRHPVSLPSRSSD